MEKTYQVAVLLKDNLPDTKDVTRIIKFCSHPWFDFWLLDLQYCGLTGIGMGEIEDVSYWPEEN